MEPVEQVAAAVMYEGYVLWPYRRSAPKNRQRWTFGALFPRGFSETAGTLDPWRMQTQCLLTSNRLPDGRFVPAMNRAEEQDLESREFIAGSATADFRRSASLPEAGGLIESSPETYPAVLVRIRFLHVVERRVARPGRTGDLELVDEWVVDGERYLSWEEATEREVRLEISPRETETQRVPLFIPAGQSEEPLLDRSGEECGRLVRSWEALHGTVECRSERLKDGLFRLTVRVENTTPWEGQNRERSLRRSFVSTHAILTARDGEFISLTDPSEEHREAAALCENRHTWPVLVGEPGQRDTLLSAPIILSDYPQVAPESSGDLFDCTEIDQLLLLNVLTLTDEEKREMRASDPRTRAILERSEALTPDDFMQLHGAIRDFRVLRPDEGDPFPGAFGELERPVPESVWVEGVEIRRGSRVRLRPHSGRDVMDGILAGKLAVVEAIEQDYEDRVHVAVTVEDDSGRALGEARMMGHRFFFAPDEISPVLPNGGEKP